MPEEMHLETVIETRAANALFADAHVSSAAIGRLADSAEMSGQWLWARLLPRIVTRQMSALGARQGGLWVGGLVVLATTSLRFQPNQMNVNLHEKPAGLEVEVPLSEILDLRLRRGLITNIIDVRSATGLLSIRCFRASSFRAQIWQQVEFQRINGNGG
ncbi:hypothetical protein EAH87_03345 [Sphingomonas koreensis]|nr:hypothetical protein EAH87_03345 [Sphingomonas koreensis]